MTQTMMCVVSVVLMLILVFIVFKTKIGLAMRASQQNAKAAKMMGIDVNFVISFTFFLAGVSATLQAPWLPRRFSPPTAATGGLKRHAGVGFGGIEDGRGEHSGA